MARYPRIAKDEFGNILSLQAVYVSGSRGPMYLQSSFQAAGDASPASYANVTDGSSAIEIEDDTFDLTAPPEGPGRWWVRLVISGETDPSDWWSADSGATLTRAT